MGGRQSLEIECEEMREHEWQEEEHEAALGRRRTLRNRRTGAMVDEYQLSWPTQREFCFYLKSFNWRSRRRTNAPVVSAHFLKPLSQAQDLCSPKYTAALYLQHIGLRLSHIEDVPLAEALYILTEALEGYTQLYQHSGYFRICEEQICIDRIGRVKVWVNAELAKNYPQCDTDCGRNQKDEVDMVEQLLEIVTAATDPEEMPSPSLLQYFDMTRKREEVAIGFEYAKIIAIEFSKLHQIRIPTRFDTVMELLSPQPESIIKNYSHCLETLPSSIEFLHQRSQCMPSPRLHPSHSMPSIHPSSNSTISYQQLPPRIEPQPYFESTCQEPPRAVTFNSQQFAAEVQESLRLEQINSRHFEESSGGQQTKRKSGNSKHSHNSRSQMISPLIATIEPSTSLHFNDFPLEDRNTMRSVPNRSRGRRRANMEQILYSQCIGETFEGGFNQDAFGMGRRRMKESTSSNRFPSSNSSQYRNSQRLSRNSKKSTGSSFNKTPQMLLSPSPSPSPSPQLDSLPATPKRQLQFYSIKGEEWQLDPEIEADIRRYLG